MDEETNNTTERWDVDRRPASAQQRVRNVLRRGYESLPHLAVTDLLHRVPLIRSVPNRGEAVGAEHGQASVPSIGMGNRTAFAGYSILRPLGSGGMADVYLAKHPRLPRRDALKVLTKGMTADDEFRERFNREADLAATLFHPHIVAVHDRGEFEGQLWIAMDYVEGTDAARLAKERYRNGMSDRCRDFAAAVNEKVSRRGALKQRSAGSVKLGRRFSLKTGIAVATAVTLAIALTITWAVSFFSWGDQPQSNPASP